MKILWDNQHQLPNVDSGKAISTVVASPYVFKDIESTAVSLVGVWIFSS